MNSTMDENQTWRTFLGQLIADPQERQRIADMMNINPVTLQRWTTGKSNPRPDNLPPLVAALPHYRQQLTVLIAREYPTALQVPQPEAEPPVEISAAFYTQVLNAYTSNTAQQRKIAVYNLILQQIVTHLDPQQVGLVVVLSLCVPPRSGQMIRSLRQVNARSSITDGHQLEYMTQFFGAESQTGHAASTGHPVIIQNQQEKLRLFPLHYCEHEECSVAYPILLSDQVAGTLAILCKQPDFFTQAYLDLIQNYVNLLVLAFEPDDFYAIDKLKLGIMPPRQQQYATLATFKQRVANHLIEANQNMRYLSPRQAETIVWQEIEELLLHTPLS
ncbi:GAF domain-containing protein [Dictyobacter aurantiacus]|uniref:GAF domain-containing protein n=1 Tax=Dictyobacter aurantiacus TaxID=1936993 RepID=A0A401ZBM0_9CHLR|nr:GAF domain-containing protein [Dictyobacter aurantiacus]GCE04301.1 hypothetical protein KDAU_16300 [Dictyobacter aurantiacus]